MANTKAPDSLLGMARVSYRRSKGDVGDFSAPEQAGGAHILERTGADSTLIV